MHFITKFTWTIYENDNIMLFQAFLSVPSVVFAGSLSVALKRAGLLVMKWGCGLGDGESYCRCLEWPPLSAIACHQALGEVRHRLVDCVLVADLPRWSARQLSTRQSSQASARVYGSFPAWCPRRDRPAGSNLDSLRAILFSKWTRLLPVTVLRDARMLKNGWNGIILSLLDIFQQDFVVNCTLYSLTLKK